MNKLYYGDNLNIMRGMPKECVDLIYLDPPFNSKRNYNLLYKNMTGRPAPDQDIAFCDTWEMDEEKIELAKNMPILMKDYGIEDYYVEFWRLWIQALRHTNEKLLAYLIYMVQRILHMKVILKPGGSLYLHCDPEASHYIKVMLDGIFGHGNFRNEIVWKRTSAHSDSGTMGWVHDILLYYTKGGDFTFNTHFGPYDPEYISSHYTRKDASGRVYRTDNVTAGGLSGGGYEYEWNGITKVWRYPKERMQELHDAGRLHYTRTGSPEYIRYLDEGKGTAVSDLWNDISPINSQAKERLGYPTQKPIALLKRIIEQSSNQGDTVFDPFCGCGTSIYAAEQSNRNWIGCDIAILSVQLISDTLNEKNKLVEGKHFEVDGIPVTSEQAKVLFKKDPFELERWVVQYLEGIPTKRTGDKGIDGRVYLMNGKHIIVSVKGGNIRPTDIRDLRGVIEREEDAAGGCFVSLREPTKAMRQEAASAGLYDYRGNKYPRIQMLTIAELLEEKKEIKSSDKYRMRKGQLALPY